jgi:hypothetical protein
MRAAFGLAAAVVLALASLAQAGPLDTKQISADAKWAAHLDVDALMASSMFKKIRAQALKDQPQLEAQLRAFCNLFRFDPTTDLHGITVYGTQLKKDTGVAIVDAKVDQKLFLDLIKANPSHQASTHDKHELHAWKDDKKQQNAAFFKPNVIVFGASADEVKAALDVLEGTKPGLPGDTGALQSGLILFARARDLGKANLQPESPLSKQIDSAVLMVGENKGDVGLRVSLTVKDAEIAKHIKRVADGALSLATLAKIDDPDAMKLFDAVKPTQADKTVTVEGSAPVDLIWDLIQKEIDKKLAEKAGMGMKTDSGK